MLKWQKLPIENLCKKGIDTDDIQIYDINSERKL